MVSSELKRSGWTLYWVASDGEEDCFVVARNSRSAVSVDANYCGFESRDLTAYRVKPIPMSIARAFKKRSEEEGDPCQWPWYADEWLLKKLGAQMRDRDGITESLIDDTVYTRGAKISPRLIGRKFLRTFFKSRMVTRFGHDDKYSPSQTQIFTILGVCVARCQEIESLIAHSFILAVSDCEQRKYKTVRDIIKGWKAKTLGQMLRSIEQGYQIEHRLHASLNLFLRMRNQLIHGLTTCEQYDIESTWGQDELIAFLALFEFLSRWVRRAFRASFYASILFANQHANGGNQEGQQTLTRRQLKEASLFPEIFMVRTSKTQE